MGRSASLLGLLGLLLLAFGFVATAFVEFPASDPFVLVNVILGAGLLWYGIKGRHHIGTLESHAAATKADV